MLAAEETTCLRNPAQVSPIWQIMNNPDEKDDEQCNNERPRNIIVNPLAADREERKGFLAKKRDQDLATK